MKKTTILAAAFIAVMSSAAHAEINNDLLPGDRIKAKWDDQNEYSGFSDYNRSRHEWAQMNNTQRQEKLQQADDKYYSKNIGQRTSQAVADDKIAAKADNMTPEQRAAHRQAMHKKWAAMTPEQQAAAKAAHDKKMANMTPAQKAQMQADHKAKYDAMTPEQKAAHKAEMKKKWDAMTPAERQQWEAKKKAHMMNKSSHMTNSMSNSMTNSMTHSSSPATVPATAN